MVSGLKFVNVPFKSLQRWNWDNILLDKDGSLGGAPGDVVVSRNNFTLYDPRCNIDKSTTFINGILCSNSTTWTKLSIYSYYNYDSYYSPNAVVIINDKKREIESPKLPSQIKFPNSMMFAVESNRSYTIRFKNVDPPAQQYYVISCENFAKTDYVIIKQELLSRPTDVYLNGYPPEVKSPLTSANKHLEWYFNNSTNVIEYMLKCYYNVFNVDYMSITVQYIRRPPTTTTTTTTTKTTTTTTIATKSTVATNNTVITNVTIGTDTTTTTTTTTTTKVPDVYRECPERVRSRPQWDGNTTVYWNELDSWKYFLLDDTSQINGRKFYSFELVELCTLIRKTARFETVLRKRK